MPHPLALLTQCEITAATTAVCKALASLPVIGRLKFIEVALEEPHTFEDRVNLLHDTDARDFGSLERRAKVTVRGEQCPALHDPS